MEDEKADQTPTDPRKPVKAKDLDFEALADELTRTPEKVTKRKPLAQPLEGQTVAKADTGEKKGEKESLPTEGTPGRGQAPPRAPGADVPAPADPPRAPIFHSLEPIPDHPGQMLAASDRLTEKIVFRLKQRMMQLLDRLDELSPYDQIKLAPEILEMLAQAQDMALTAHWTKKLEKAIAEKAALLNQGRGGPMLKKLGAVAAQVQKAQHVDGRTVQGRNKARALGRLAPDDLPAAEASEG